MTAGYGIEGILGVVVLGDEIVFIKSKGRGCHGYARIRVI